MPSEHRRGQGAFYAALDRGWLEPARLRRVLAGLPQCVGKLAGVNEPGPGGVRGGVLSHVAERDPRWSVGMSSHDPVVRERVPGAVHRWAVPARTWAMSSWRT